MPEAKEPYFNEEKALALFEQWKASDDLRILNELLLLCLPIIERLISLRTLNAYESPDELRSLILMRLAKGFKHWYDPQKGRVFTFVTKSTGHGLTEAIRRCRRANAYYVSASDGFTNSILFSVNGQEHSEALEDIRYRVQRIKTLSVCPHEREAQRWLVRNLITADFVFLRDRRDRRPRRRVGGYR